MHFSTQGGFYRAVRITGPTHNVLALRLEQATPSARPNIVRLAGPSGRRGALNEERLVAAVLAGVESANARHATQWAVTHIEYVEDDSPPETVYRMMAFAIAERLIDGGSFTDADRTRTS